MASSKFHYADDVQKELGITNEIRVVLIGKTGAGKSASGNTLLGRKNAFPSEVSSESITDKCSFKTAERFGKILMVVDTPGVFDTEKTNEEITKEIVKCIGISSPGPHAFILVLQIGRFTKEEQNTVQTFRDIFGEEMYNHMIILFTRRDDIDRHNMDIHQYIKSKATNQLKALVQKCNGQVFALNNIQEVTEKEKDVEKFINLVKEISRKNGENHYSNDMYEEAEKRMRKRIEEIKRIQEMEKENAKKKMKEEMELEYQKKMRDFEEQTRESYEKMREYEEKLRIERAQKEEEREKVLELKYKLREDDIRREARTKIAGEDENLLGLMYDGVKQVAVGIGSGITSAATKFYEYFRS